MMRQWPEEGRFATKKSSVIDEKKEHIIAIRKQLDTLHQLIHEDGMDERESEQSMFKATEGERLLVIDDDETARVELVRRLRADGYEVDESSNVDNSERILRKKSYHLIILNLNHYPKSGYELIEFVKEDPTLKWISLIVLSEHDSLDDKIRCFQLGADDFVTKPFRYNELGARIHILLKRTRNFEQMAFRDPLTGAYNRRFFGPSNECGVTTNRALPDTYLTCIY